ncbi:MAG: hypothetical protein JNL22_05690 [Bacteroidales bacterium]|jgi:hypothetical protein|nr:hypothetical protein [Bacteroidales bacterium]
MNRSYNPEKQPVGGIWSALFLLVFIFIGSTGSAGGQTIAVFKSPADFLDTGNGQFRTVFTLNAGKEQYEQLVSVALSMPETLTLESKRIKKDKYSCSVTFIHPTDTHYVKKTLLNLGIEQVIISNKQTALPDLDPETL